MNTEEARKALQEDGYPEGHEQTLVLVKPDGVRMGIHPAVAAIFEAHELNVFRDGRIRFDAILASAFYIKHEAMPYFQELLRYVTSGDCKAYILIGLGAAERAHKLLGATDPRQAEPSSIRGLFRGHFDPDQPVANFVHASGNLSEAAREIGVLFGEYPVEPRDDD